jgi:Uma2 family endonuclease
MMTETPMSSRAHSLVTWPEFLRLPERPDTGQRHELHDGEVVLAPPARPLHIKLQKRIEHLLETLAAERGIVTIEFPYRPAPNLQFWFADVAYVPRADWDAMPPNDYPVYSSAWIVEVLSPSNAPAKIARQRIVAMSAGTQEFWVVDPEKRTVQVTDGASMTVYTAGDTIPVSLFESTVSVDDIFKI